MRVTRGSSSIACTAPTPDSASGAHRAKLQRLERASAEADPLLRVEDRTAVLELDRGGEQQPQRRRDQQADAGEGDVKCAFHVCKWSVSVFAAQKPFHRGGRREPGAIQIFSSALGVLGERLSDSAWPWPAVCEIALVPGIWELSAGQLVAHRHQAVAHRAHRKLGARARLALRAQARGQRGIGCQLFDRAAERLDVAHAARPVRSR